jgi:Putative Ig domain
MIRGSRCTARLFTAALVFLGLSLAANLVGCGGSSTPPPTGITIQGPTNGTIDPGDSATFTATVTNDSHNAGVTWTLTGNGCTGSACGALSNSSTTGVTYTAPATVTTAFTVTITVTSAADSGITTTIMLSVPANPSITTAAGTLPGGVIGTPYSVTLAGAGGITPYTWSITQGMLPAGLGLNATTGVISGTPSAAGSTTFTVVLTDSGSPALTATEQFTIAIAYPSPTINTSMLANGTFGTAYSGMITASGGSGGGYTFAVTSGTGLSAVGLSLAPSGAITGTPNGVETAGTFVVTVTDSAGDTASATISLTVVYSAITITPATLPNGTMGTAYAQSLAASGGSGTGYSYAVTSGTGLSAVGLSLSSAGAITGTPSAGETAGTFVVTVTDSAGNKGTATITLTVIYPFLTITTTTLPNGIVGTAYSQTLNATSGSGTGYTWSVTSGAASLSAVGLSLSSSGVLSGSTPVAGTATFTVQVTDSANNTATANLTVTIYPSLVVSTTSLANGTEGTAYTATLAATGGSGTGYTWTVTSGTGLSAVGLSLSTSGAITGIPTKGESAVPVTVQVTDSNGDTATGTLTLTVAAVVFQGQVLSGQQPVAGAAIQLYTVGSAGNGSAATPMLTQTVVTDGIGMFNLAGFYTCGQDSSGSSIAGTSNQVYLVATGGSTSLTSTSGNGALVMVTAVGSCSNLASTPFFTINEITTAAAAWALAPFSASATNIGGSATNVLGIDNAFLDAALLANPATGAPATLPTGLSVETSKLNAFADVLNTCTASADGTGCATLFTAATPASGTTPVNSFNAALNIVQNPGQNVAAVFAVIPTTTTPPFATTLTASPNDWTMALTVTGGGLATPTALGIDSLNNIWVADEDGPLSAFNAQGTPLSSTGYGIVSGASLISNVFGLAIDPSNNIWVTNEQGYQGGGDGSITEFYGVNNPSTFPTGTSPQPTGYTTNVFFPVSIAADTNSNIYVANTGAFTSVSIYSNTGTVLAPALGVSVATSAGENSIAIDTSNGFWLSDNAESVEHFSSTGALLVNAACCEESTAIATDSAGDLWVADYLGGADGHGAVAEAVTDSSGNTSVPIEGLVTGGINYPQAVAVDAAQNVWFANKVNGSVTELAGINSTLAVGTAISPSTGVYNTGGYGLDDDLEGPYSLLPDRSGNLWVSNEGGNNITMFFGLAAPTVTPLQPVPTAP